MKKIFISIFIFTIALMPLVTMAGATVQGGNATVSLSNPIQGTATGPATPQVIIGRIINSILGLVGSLALAMFIYGGFTWMMASGNEQRVQKGKDILMWATVGLIIIFSSYAILRLVFKGIGLAEE